MTTSRMARWRVMRRAIKSSESKNMRLLRLGNIRRCRGEEVHDLVCQVDSVPLFSSRLTKHLGPHESVDHLLGGWFGGLKKLRHLLQRNAGLREKVIDE